MSDSAWTALGLASQACFFMRFLLQWIASEKRQESVIPISFWYWSLGGSAGLLLYAWHVRDPVFLLGQSTGFLIYIRNLMMIRRRPA